MNEERAEVSDWWRQLQILHTMLIFLINNFYFLLVVKFLKLKKKSFWETYHKNLFPVSVENCMIWSAFLHENLELSCVPTHRTPTPRLFLRVCELFILL